MSQSLDMIASNRRYLGDGVYVSFDGYQLWLTTEDGVRVTNTIALEPSVWEALTTYVARLKSGDS